MFFCSLVVLEGNISNMLDSLHETVLNSILRELDLPTLATVEATSNALKISVRKCAISAAVITSPMTTCFPSPINTPNFKMFISWLKKHVHQFRSVVVVEDDPDAAGAIGIALAGAHALTSLRTISSTTSGWRVPSCMMYAACPCQVPPLTTLKLGRGSTSPGFLATFAATLQSLVITVSTMQQTKEVLGLRLPEIVDLRVGATCSLPFDRGSDGGGGIFPKLRHLTMSNIDFRSKMFFTGPPELDSLVLINCGDVHLSGLPGTPVIVHLGIHGMQFPADMELSRLQEVEVSHLKYRFPNMSLPDLRRFQGSYSDISVNIAHIPKIWTATIGQGCTGDKSWLLKVPHVFL